MSKVYEIITDRIIAELEKGCVPWKSPFLHGKPQNLITKKPYRGINAFILGISPFSSPFWLTFKQVNEKGGSVKQGEHGTPIVFWKINDVSPATETGEGEEIKVEGGETAPERNTARHRLLRYYKVFNLEQTEGISPPPLNNHTSKGDCDKLVEDTHAVIKKGSKACYMPTIDTIQIPDAGYFVSVDEYYSTLFHELSHWTGHSSRLCRNISALSSYAHDETYSQEELVAEMGSAFLQAHMGITSALENSAAYISSWLETLRNDKRMVIIAAAQAQKAADYIIGCGEE
jgi:antirestriction protein ArdC